MNIKTISLTCLSILFSNFIQSSNLSINVLPHDMLPASYQAKVFLLTEGLENEDDQRILQEVNEYAPQLLISYFQNSSFEGKYEEVVEIPLSINGNIINHIFIGLGKPSDHPDDTCEYLRRSFSLVIPLIKKYKMNNIVAYLPEYLEQACNRSYADLIYECGLISLIGNYEYNEFKSSRTKEKEDATISFVLPNNNNCMEESKQCCDIATILATSINKARSWMDGPPNLVTPDFMTQRAQDIAEAHDNLSLKVLEEEDALRLGMGAFMGVSQGSALPGKIVILEYRCEDPEAQTIGLCGKGITFDTGGVSLKPPAAMLGMKDDMCGGACVLALMDLVAEFKPRCNVIGIAPFAENMPDGNSYREDDILTAMNGKTIEIINTDAEGRLALADALCYLEKEYNPDIIFTIATLTGAARHALGAQYTAFMTKDHELMQLLQQYGNHTGDRMWPLPLHDDFIKGNKSEVADVANAGSKDYLAGTIIAACFLQNFVQHARWAHLDIAASSNHVPGVNYLGSNATGASIRTLIHIIMDYSVQKAYYEQLIKHQEIKDS